MNVRAVWVAAVLAGCADAPVAPGGRVSDAAAPPAPAAPVVVQAPESSFEARMRARAQALERSGAWGEAALGWEILLALRPGEAEYRERLADLRKRIAQAVDAHTRQAREARARGELAAAQRHYLTALALDPGERDAKEGLRAIERMQAGAQD